MTKPIPGPREETTPPRRPPPPGAVDCHFHVFGPAGRYPLSPGRGYTPPDCPLEAYLRMLGVLGIERAVSVHPSVYGTDNTCSLDALRALGARGRGVAVIDAGTGDGELDRMHAAGVRGARFNLVSAGALSLDLLEPTAARLAERGWHLQVFASSAALAALSTRLAALPVDVVIDHIGHVGAAAGVDQPAVRLLLELLESGRFWIKLSGAYRVDDPDPWPRAGAIARALVAARPDRLVWGTDWPHPDLSVEMPDDGVLLDALADWVPDEATWQAILVDNPARLYDFR